MNGRKLEFVTFDVIPTGDDSANVLKWVSDQVTQFAAATNDTLYVDVNSDTRFDTLAHPRSFYPEEVQARLFSDSVGSIIGPIYANGKYRIYKVEGVKNDSLFQMRASHILFKVENNDTPATMKKAQEVLAEIRKGADFGEKAAQYGTDGTSSRGGDLGWFTEGQMVKEFNDYVKKGNKGDMAIVKTQFGIHIVKVTENKTKKTVVAGVLERGVEPSEATTNQTYNDASQFASIATGGAEAFDAAIAEKGLSKRVADNLRETDKSLAGLSEAREVIRWAYNASIGDVSEVMSIGDKYIVATLVAVKEKDKANFEDVKERLTADFRKEKKADQLMEKVKAEMAGATTLQDIATKLQVAVTPIVGQTMENSNIAYIGPDNTFIGTIFGTETIGKIIGPIKGDNAVYVANIIRFSDGPQVPEYTAYKEEIQNQLSQRMEYGSFDVLKQLKDVKDNRYKFY
jgi:peptidyl-prolyl cis-trans isomerase D